MDKVNEVTRGFVNAFFDLTLEGEARSVLGGVSVHTDVYLYIYPLERT